MTIQEFYIKWLGFKVDWEHRFEADAPVYMQISKGDIVWYLTEHHGGPCPGAKTYIETEGVREYHKEITAKDHKYNKPGLET